MSEEKEEVVNKEETVNNDAACENCNKLKEDLEACVAGRQRALADYQNLQKETEKSRLEMMGYAKEMILEEFIPVYEHLKLALQEPGIKSKELNDNPWVDGVKHVIRQFADILKDNGVEEIKTVGEKFDPTLHEAVGEEDGGKPGIVVKEVSGGYRMGERVIRAAKVIVSK